MMKERRLQKIEAARGVGWMVSVGFKKACVGSG